MGEDLSTGAKIGIILIILCSLIAIVFSLLTMMKNITSQGAGQLQGNLDQMLLTTFEDYNQKTVSGTDVTTAYKLFEGQDVAIIVKPGLANTGKNGTPRAMGGLNFGALLVGYDKGTDMPGYGTVFLNNDYNLNTSKVLVGDQTIMPQLSNMGDFDGTLMLHMTGSYYVGEFFKEPGSTATKLNLNTKPLKASGNYTYVRSSAKYRAMLIKDAADMIIGVVFNEIVDIA